MDVYTIELMEFVPALKGLGEPKRTGKNTSCTVGVFKDETSARQWCEEVGPGYAVDEPDRTTHWFDIWMRNVNEIKEDEEGFDPLFIAAYTKFGTDIGVDWTPEVETVVDAEDDYWASDCKQEIEDIGEKVYKEAKISMTFEQIVDIVRTAVREELEYSKTLAFVDLNDDYGCKCDCGEPGCCGPVGVDDFRSHPDYQDGFIA